uniref:Uncharacterized protein n=1 Tax=Lactuca sativa TaxID=4236 RepID=A0A9R1XJL8_LACSA|nr:hypothetical protein LSAT_V11C300117620 [Lactuca sativa]
MVSDFIKTTYTIHFIRQQSSIHKSQELDNMSFMITRVCMAAGVAAVNGHTHTPIKSTKRNQSSPPFGMARKRSPLQPELTRLISGQFPGF